MHRRCAPRVVLFVFAACGCGSGVAVAQPAAKPDAAATQPAPNLPVQTQPAAAPPEAQDDGSYHLADGPYTVAVVERFKLRDEARDKTLEMTIRAPAGLKDGDRVPVVVFSHGAGGNADAFPDLSRHWASRGYVVIHPTHSDSVRLRREQGERINAREEMSGGIVRRVDLRDRIADVSFILDSLGEIEGKVPGLKDADGNGRIDREKVGAAGHSAGAFTTQLAAGVKARGARLGIRGGAVAIGDSRIKAAVVISGQGTTSPLLTEESWKDLTLPMLTIAGSKDVSRVSNETPESRRHPFEKAGPGDKYLVFIEGATHSSYGGKGVGMLLDGEAPDHLDLIVQTVSSSTTAFLDWYLKGDAAAKAYLEGDGLMRFGKGLVEYKRK